MCFASIEVLEDFDCDSFVHARGKVLWTTTSQYVGDCSLCASEPTLNLEVVYAVSLIGIVTNVGPTICDFPGALCTTAQVIRFEANETSL